MWTGSRTNASRCILKAWKLYSRHNEPIRSRPPAPAWPRLHPVTRWHQPLSFRANDGQLAFLDTRLLEVPRKSAFFSSDESEEEEDHRKKFKIKIKPLPADQVVAAPSVDELKASIGNIALSPSPLVSQSAGPARDVFTLQQVVDCDVSPAAEPISVWKPPKSSVTVLQ